MSAAIRFTPMLLVLLGVYIRRLARPLAMVKGTSDSTKACCEEIRERELLSHV